MRSDGKEAVESGEGIDGNMGILRLQLQMLLFVLFRCCSSPE